MKRIVWLALVVFCILVPVAKADESLVGTYDGTFTATSGFSAGVRIEIISVVDGKIQGSGFFYGPVCAGKFAIKEGGTVVGREVSFTLVSKGRCGERAFRLVWDGNRLDGIAVTRTGELQIQTSK